MEPAHSIEPQPEQFGRYQVVRAIATGGSGATYLCAGPLNRKVAVKIGDRGSVAQFNAEAAARGKLTHPSIPAVHESGVLPDGRPFLATEWIDGTPLDLLLADRQTLSLREALRIAVPIADALGHAHAMGILHLDVKPGNILVGENPDEPPQLLDFGVSDTVRPETGKTQAGFVVGTPFYMASEQLRGEGFTPATDVYALGLVLFEMLHGRRAYEGSNIAEIFSKVIAGEHLQPDAKLPTALRDLLARCLAKDANRRPKDGADLAAELKAIGAQQEFAQFFESPAMPAPPSPPASPEFTQIFGPPAATPAPASPPVPPAVRPSAPQASGIFGQHSTRDALPLALPAATTIPAPAHQTTRMAVALAGVAGFLAAVLALGLAMAFWRPAGANALHAAFAAAGLAIIAGSVAAGLRVRAFLQSRRDEFARNASDLLAGIQDTSSLSRTLALQVDDVIAKCRLMDERFLGLTMAVMVREYNSAERFDDRQKALMNAITILEKLGPKLSPWYIRHDRLIAATVSIVGIASGAVTVASNLSKLLRGA